MTTETPQTSSSGGDVLFTVVAVATIVVAALEALFIPSATWMLLGLTLLLLILAAIAVVWSVGHLIDSEPDRPAGGH